MGVLTNQSTARLEARPNESIPYQIAVFLALLSITHWSRVLPDADEKKRGLRNWEVG